MGLTKKDGALLLAVVAAVCIQLYQAQHVVGRCRCYEEVRLMAIKRNITDFQVKEKSAACSKIQLIVTFMEANSTAVERCVKPQGYKAKQILKCWEGINKNESRKMECINQ
uniref:Chemokine interleukin-8-like domain-containing protein n=1 Tax=Oryzias latipes TaxID=8090 RepID=A0A3P9HVT1_ORYLA